jgi:AbrB family looped-hinge helix DNA binding protein
MNNNSIQSGIRRIDDLGRIVIPRQVRELTDIKLGDQFSISARNGEIILTPIKEDLR